MVDYLRDPLKVKKGNFRNDLEGCIFGLRRIRSSREARSVEYSLSEKTVASHAAVFRGARFSQG